MLTSLSFQYILLAFYISDANTPNRMGDQTTSKIQGWGMNQSRVVSTPNRFRSVRIYFQNALVLALACSLSLGAPKDGGPGNGKPATPAPTKNTPPPPPKNAGPAPVVPTPSAKPAPVPTAAVAPAPVKVAEAVAPTPASSVPATPPQAEVKAAEVFGPQLPPAATAEAQVETEVHVVSAEAEEPPAPPRPEIIRTGVPRNLLPGAQAPEETLRSGQLEGALRAFALVFLHLSRIRRDYIPHNFDAPWIQEELAELKSDLVTEQRVVTLTSLMKDLADIYEDPEVYAGSPIASAEAYVEVRDPLVGDPEYTVAQGFEALFSKVEVGVRRSRYVPLGKEAGGNDSLFFSDPKVATEAQVIERQTSRTLQNVLSSVMSGAQSGGTENAVSIMDVMIGTFVRTLVTDKTEIGINAAHFAAQVFDGEATFGPASEAATIPKGKTRGAQWAYWLEELLRGSKDFRSAEQKFVRFLRLLANQEPDTMGTILLAFEHGLAEVVRIFAREAGRIAEQIQVPGASRAEKKRDVELLKLFLQKYPLLLPAAILKDIIFDMLALPVNPSPKAMISVVLHHAGPILQQYIQTHESGVVDGPAVLQVLAAEAQDGGRLLPRDLLLNILRTDPAHYFPADAEIRFQPITASFLERLPTIPEAERSKLFILDPAARAGKFWVSYRTIFEGKPHELLRVLRPDGEYRLKVDHLIFRHFSEEIARYWQPPGKMATLAHVEQVERQLDDRKDAYLEELDPMKTYRNQMMGREQVDGLQFPSQDGRADIFYHVPDLRPTVEGSSLMMMEEATDLISLADFVSSYPQLARDVASSQYGVFYDGAAWNPLEAANENLKLQRKAQKEGAKSPTLEEPFGLVHRDLHKGNILISVRRNKDNGRTGVHVYWIDWGLTSILKMEDLKDIFFLTFGGATNDSVLIGKALWKLSTEAPLGSLRNDMERTAYVKERWDELMKRVQAKARALNANWQYWGPGDWIYWTVKQGLLQFPEYISGIADGMHALAETTASLHGLGRIRKDLKRDIPVTGQPNTNVMDRLADRGRTPVLWEAFRRHPVRAAYAASTALAQARARSCFQYIGSFGGLKHESTPISPEDD